MKKNKPQASILNLPGCDQRLSPDIDGDVSRETLEYHLLDSFVYQTSLVISGHALVGAINVVLLWGRVSLYFVFAWAGFLLLTVMSRWWMKRHYQLNKQSTSPRFWQTIFALSSLLLGLVWLVWCLHVGTAIGFDGTGLSILVITVAGLVSGAVASTSSLVLSYILFAVPILLPLSAVLLFNDQADVQGIGLLMVIFFIFILRQVLKIHSVLKESILKGLELEKSKEQTEALASELYQLSTTDALTSVTNRRGFDEALSREWLRAKRSSSPLSLLMIDVDAFKPFNDSLGHPAGDACLQSIAAALPDYVRRAGETIARYGGEEFAVLLPNTTGKEGVEIAENIRQGIVALDIKHPASAVADRVTVSIGVHGAEPGQLEGSEELIVLADRALYQAKTSGRNCVRSTPFD
jgi:diguanylate cyclase (GGDEF)-like protein